MPSAPSAITAGDAPHQPGWVDGCEPVSDDGVVGGSGRTRSSADGEASGSATGLGGGLADGVGCRWGSSAAVAEAGSGTCRIGAARPSVLTRTRPVGPTEIPSPCGWRGQPEAAHAPEAGERCRRRR